MKKVKKVKKVKKIRLGLLSWSLLHFGQVPACARCSCCCSR